MADQSVDQVEYMLSTIDNPFDPFTQFDEWLAFDTNSGYQTPGMLARIAFVSNELSEADQMSAIQSAIEEIVEENVLGIYIKVSRKPIDSVN